MNYYASNRKTNRFLRPPASWEEYEAEIEWTPVDEIWTLLDPSARATMRNAADALQAQYTILTGFTEGDAYLNTDINDFRMLSGGILDVMAEVAMALRLLGAEPYRDE